MQVTTDPATNKKLVPKKPLTNIALLAAALGLYKGVYTNAQRAMGEMNKAYPNSIASHNGVKLIKECKDKIFRYYQLNPPKEDTGMKRTFSVEKIVESAGAAVQSTVESANAAVKSTVETVDAAALSVERAAGAAVQSLRESFREEPAEDEAEKVLPTIVNVEKATPDVKQELNKDYPLARKATPTKVLPTIVNVEVVDEAEADKRAEPKKPAIPACLQVCNIQ